MEPADMMAGVAASMKERTGRTLDEWVALVRSEGPDPLDQKAVRAWAPGPRGTLRIGLRYRGEAPTDERLSPAKGFAQATHWLHLPADARQADVDSLAPLVAAAYGDNG